MTIEAGFIAHLLGATRVTALVGQRIRPMLAPQQPTRNAASGGAGGALQSGDVAPYIVTQLISHPRHQSLTASEGLADARIQVTCYGRTYTEAKQVFESVRLSSDGYRGDMGGVRVESCLLDDESDGLESSVGLDAQRSFAVAADFILMHQETKPEVPALV